MISRLIWTLGIALFGITQAGISEELTFRDQELATRLQVGYAVRLVDLNGDQRLDIAIVDSKRILWLENPNWDEHVIHSDPDQANDNVCFAIADIDRDGKLDFALGSDWQFRNTESGGTIGWLKQGDDPRKPWTYHAIGSEPTVHRMEFADLDQDGRDELIVAPLKGRNTTDPDFSENGVRILSFAIPQDPVTDAWEPTVINDDLHVVHNIAPVAVAASTVDLLAVSFEGVHWLRRRQSGDFARVRIGTGDQGGSPSRGASEIKYGQLSGGKPYLATIEPWHGNKVVVYTPSGKPLPPGLESEWLWRRSVLDDQLKWGHAVECANLDDDDDQELIIGVRDDLNSEAKRGLRIYDPTNGDAWKTFIVDPGSVAIEDLTSGDLNGDDRIDIVAVGRQTHNVKIYWNETK